MAVEVGQVAGPVAHPRLAEGQHLPPEQIIALAAEEGAVDMVRVVVEVGLLLDERDAQVAGDVVRAGVGLVLVDDGGAAGDAAVDLEGHGGRLAEDAVPAAHGALVLDGLAAPAARVALHLELLEHAGRELVLDDAHAVAAADAAGLDDAVGRPAAVALLADLLLLPLELRVHAVVEVAQRDAHPDLHVAPARLSSLVVAAPAEEPAEQVERIVVVPSASTWLALFEPLVSVLVVDLACVRVN